MRLPNLAKPALKPRLLTGQDVAKHGFCITRNSYFYPFGIFDGINARVNDFFTSTPLQYA